MYDYEAHVYSLFAKEYMKSLGGGSNGDKGLQFKNFLKLRSYEIKPNIIQQDLQLKIKTILD